MPVRQSTFIKNFSNAISEGDAAIFAGAGLSISSGFYNWKELIKPLASEIDLDIEKEHDLVSVAQFYQNAQGRNEINQKILNEFTRATDYNENIDILTRLSISTYWTTNYDSLIEVGLEKNSRKPDVKITQDSLANNIHDRDAVVYKMHGDVRNPQDAVLVKDDYETYHLTHSLFITALKGDLISKTFLFIGFSFEDPNLNSILGRIKALIGTNMRTHYCFFEKVQNHGDSDKFAYDTIKQNLVIDDLKRYGIKSVMLDSYSEITDILKSIEEKCNMKNIFISASLEKANSPWSNEKAKEFTYMLANSIVKNNFRITSGYGLGLGSEVITGALDEIMSNKYKHINEHLQLRPFPRQVSMNASKRRELWKNYRIEMIHDCGFAIFIFGNKKKGDEIVIANGIIQEFEIANNLGVKVIPVGSTGDAAKEIYDRIKSNIDDYKYLEPYIDSLGSLTNPEELADLIIKIVCELREA